MITKKQIRRRFFQEVFDRDGGKCRVCGCKTDSLDAHHIHDRGMMPGGGYVKENGILLCGVCHLKAEKFHVTKGASWHPGYAPKDLYDMIGSSYEIAREAAQVKLDKFNRIKERNCEHTRRKW